MYMYVHACPGHCAEIVKLWLIMFITLLPQLLSSRLDILAMSTNQLVRHFYLDILKHQHRVSRGETRYSELLLSVGYIKETSSIEVTVVHGDNMSK